VSQRIIAAAILALSVQGSMAGTAAAQGPQESGHGHAAPAYDLRDFTPEERGRIDHLQSVLICACPTEGWAKTLNGCQEGCAQPQKTAIRAAIKAGKTDQEIIDEQVQAFGERVKAIPDSTLSRLVPFLALSALTVVVLGLLLRSVRRKGVGGAGPGRPRRAGEPPAAAADPGREKELADLVERDLTEMDE
jgi:cytochrome c-type biogenesis protein CcmH/NrfF